MKNFTFLASASSPLPQNHIPMRSSKLQTIEVICLFFRKNSESHSKTFSRGMSPCFRAQERGRRNVREGLGLARRRARPSARGQGHPAPPLRRARQNGGARPSRGRSHRGACALVCPARPTPAREAVTAVDGGRGAGQEGRTTPQAALERAVPASPAPAPVVRSRPLRTAGRSVSAGRAPCFRSSPLCPGARRGERGDAHCAVRLRKGAGGAPGREPGMGAAPVRHAPAPPRHAPGRHFVLSRARPPRDGRPEAQTTKAGAQGLRRPQVFPTSAGRRWRRKAAAVPQRGGKWAPLLGLPACTRSSMPKLVFVSGIHELMGSHVFLCARPRECSHTRVCVHVCLHRLVAYAGLGCMGSVCTNSGCTNRCAFMNLTYSTNLCITRRHAQTTSWSPASRSLGHPRK